MKKLYSTIAFILLTANYIFAGENTVSLAGRWDFETDRADEGIAQKWFIANLSDNIVLPGSMTENLKGAPVTLKTKFTGSIYDSSWFFNPAMEKYRHADNLKMPFWLTPVRHYTGAAWYSRTIEIPKTWRGSEITLFLERAHISTQVWIGNTCLGRQISLNTPHCYILPQNIGTGKHRLTILVDNRMKDVDVGQNSHSVSDHTQTNWNGIIGRIELQSRPAVNISDIQVFPDIAKKSATVKINIKNLTDKTQKGEIMLLAESFNSTKYHKIEPLKIPFLIKKENDTLSAVLQFGDNMLLWSEFEPALYRLSAKLVSGKMNDSREISFGMRQMGIEGKYFTVNGQKTMLRGTVENCVFPLTGYPPMDVASWERVFRICKSFGLNHMRFHSFCPPEAAFRAADLAGIYLQPEGPSWPNHSTRLGRGLPIDTFLMNETVRMTKFYGNYASFAFLASGNEPSGNWVPWVSRFVNYWKATDSRRLYTGASVGQSWAWQPDNQYHVKAGARGLNWNRGPEAASDYRQRLEKIAEPYVSHESGQYCVFPNFDEIPKYTGITRARNFELFKDNLADNDMSDLAHRFLMASGRLQALCYKHEIERTLRTPDYAGFQLLSLNDYSGQGTALVGILDAFWDEKGYINARQFRRFCNTTVPLARMEKFVYRNSETFNTKIEVSHFGNKMLKNQRIIWKIRDSYGLTLQQGVLAVKDIPIGSGCELGTVSIDLRQFITAAKLNLEITLEGTEFGNDWDFWVYPPLPVPEERSDVYITDSLDERAVATLKDGGKVLILAAKKISYGKDVVQHYLPVFWNTSWFKMRPPHTTGVVVNSYHPAFRDFPTDDWANLQWWELVHNAQCMLLSDFPKGFRPVVQPVDTWFINRKLGLLFEAKAGKGKLMMTSMNLTENLTERPVAELLYHSLLKYVNSDKFCPETEISLQNIRDLFEKKAAPYNFFTAGSPDELKKDIK